jgi:BirA family biotin operon repressor/biotin-[acetyl-CoA-carboxylase] ligase
MENKLLSILNKELKLDINTIILEETSSTNDYCKNLAKSTKEDTLVIALSQTNGKGRLGRSFFSPKESGIYLSLLLHPLLKADDCTKITTAAAVAAAETIDFISGKNSKIKWVNDIYLDSKKVAGILTEAGFSSQSENVQYAVLGLGVNLFNPMGNFPEDIKGKAGSVFGSLLPSAEITVKFIKEFIKRFFDIYAILPDTLYMENYKSRSMLIGKNVSFVKNGEKINGFVLGIDNDAGLLLATDKGSITLKAGEVSINM